MPLRLFCLLLLVLSATARSEPLFDSDEPLAIRLSAPFRLIDRERDKDKEYEGTLSYDDPAHGPTTLQAKLSVRGNFRLRKDVCSHAQLWVNLKKGEVKGTLFDGQNKLKLVVQCKDSDRYAEYLARERQAYLMFQALSELSLATRPLMVSYSDSEEGDSREQMAFFIQHQKNLAKAHDMEVFDEERAPRDRLDPQQSATVALFMYLVSNTDYSMIAAAPGDSCCHNIKLLQDADGRLYPLPYDYDSTGFVDASYAEPATGIGQRNVQERMYRGYCAEEAVTMAAVELHRSKRDSIYAIAESSPVIRDRSVKRTRKYLDKFYDVIDDPRKLQREVLEECR
ncbi:MAG: hypothetical protein V2I82_17370 [Halieaceae bacterium]|jgi:hypothetical protein|nr:hypothetical protein [Halieaceae bacterium]